MNDQDLVAIDRAAPPNQLDRRAKELAISVEMLVGGAAPWGGWTYELSPEGLSASLDRRFELGTPLLITFEEGTDRALTVLAKVTWVEGASHGWLHGCQFVKPVGEEDFRLLLEKIQAPPTASPVSETLADTPVSKPTHVNLHAIRDKLRQLGPAPNDDPNDPR